MRKPFVSELELLEYSKCPMRVYGVSEKDFYVNPQLFSALETLKLCLSEQFNGRHTSITSTREAFASYYAAFDIKETVETAMQNAGICSRINGILNSHYDVVQPVTNYNLTIGPMVVQGSFAILRDLRDPVRLIALYPALRFSGWSAPDVVSYARWLSMYVEKAGYESLSVLRYSLSISTSVVDLFDVQQARAVLNGVVKAFDSHTYYPAPAAHCSTCVTNACRKIL